MQAASCRPRQPSPAPPRGQPLDLGPGPVPPSLLEKVAQPSVVRARAAGLTPVAATYSALAAPSVGAVPEPRVPSPLPPILSGAIPSEIRLMAERLNQLVAQSNDYVQGLAQRLEVLERERHSLDGPASIESLRVFLETRPCFSGLDADRIAPFRLPLHVWQHVAEQVQSEHGSNDRGLESILYWRARAEAEAMGLLIYDRRSSGSSSYSRFSERSQATWSSMGPAPDSRRPSLGSSIDLLPPQRPSAYSARSTPNIFETMEPFGS